MSDENKVDGVLSEVIIETCSLEHTFLCLPGHPTRNGAARCPYCLAVGFDRLRKKCADSTRKIAELRGQVLDNLQHKTEDNDNVE